MESTFTYRYISLFLLSKVLNLVHSDDNTKAHNQTVQKANDTRISRNIHDKVFNKKIT